MSGCRSTAASPRTEADADGQPRTAGHAGRRRRQPFTGERNHDHAQTRSRRHRGYRRAGGGPGRRRAGVECSNSSKERDDGDHSGAGSQPSGKGPAEWFTGTVRIDPLFTAPDPARVAGASVTFEPGARTAWHTHPLGQTLIVTAGAGWVQR